LRRLSPLFLLALRKCIRREGKSTDQCDHGAQTNQSPTLVGALQAFDEFHEITSERSGHRPLAIRSEPTKLSVLIAFLSWSIATEDTSRKQKSPETGRLRASSIVTPRYA